MTDPTMPVQPAQTVGDLQLKWGETRDMPITFADFFHWRVTQDRLHLTLGQLSTPLVDGAFPKGTIIDATPAVRLVLSEATTRELFIALQKAIGTFATKEQK